MRYFLGFGGPAAQANGLTDQAAYGILMGAVGHQCLHKVLDSSGLALVERGASSSCCPWWAHGGRDHEAEDGRGRDQAEGEGDVVVVGDRTRDRPGDADRTHTHDDPSQYARPIHQARRLRGARR